MTEQTEQLESGVRKNAMLIADFCEKAGMDACMAGAAAEWFSMCVKKAICSVDD